MNYRKMNFHWCVIVFAIFSAVCDTKSVSCDGSEHCDKTTTSEIEKSTEIFVPDEKNQLEALKENVGRVGNKLEGIVYEVLKDILRDDLDSDRSNQLSKETKPVNEISFNKIKSTSSNENKKESSINKPKIFIKNELLPKTNGTISNSTENNSNPSLYNYQLLASNIPITESNLASSIADTNITQTVVTTEANSKPVTKIYSKISNPDSSSTEKSREKRMVHENPEQTLSVENFLESNQDKNLNFPGESRGSQMSDPLIMGTDEMRSNSKQDPVRRDPKKEPTEGNRNKRPQDEVGMRQLPMPDNPPPFEATGIISNKKSQNHANSENHTIESQKKHKSSSETQRPQRRKMVMSEDHPDFRYQIRQETKNVQRNHDGIQDRRSDVKSDSKTIHTHTKSDDHFEGMSNRRTNSDLSDFQFPLQIEMKRGPNKNEEMVISRSNPDSSESGFPTHSEMRKLSKIEATNKKASATEDIGDSRLGQAYMWANPPSNCYEKNNREEVLEKQHIEDLKYEVNKLRSVVDLLKEQQRLINSFEGDKKNMNTQEMLNVLNQINNPNETPSSMEKTQYAVDTTNKANHEELGHIKIQLKDAIENLNRTQEILNLEHKKEVDLEKDLKNTKTEINWLKLIIENFIIEQAKKKLKEDNNGSKVMGEGLKTVNETTLVGARNPTTSIKKAHNRTIPSTVKMAEEKLLELGEMRSRESSSNDIDEIQTKNLRLSSPKSRASSASNIEKLLDSLNDKQSKTIDDDDNFQNRLIEAMKQVRRKKEEESFTKDILRKIQMNTIESKSEDDMLLKFQKALKALDNPQSKTDDLDIVDQLKVLQREISKLKSNDDLNLPSDDVKTPGIDNAQLQIMLKNLIANNPQFQLQGGKVPPLTPQQLIQLQKKFGSQGMVPQGILNTGIGGVGVGVGTDFGVSPPAPLMNSFPIGIGKVGPLFGPYNPNVGPYGAHGYGKDLDLTSSLGSYPGYGLGQDLSKIMSYGPQSSNTYTSSNGYNDYTAKLGYFGANNGYGSYGSGPASGNSYPSNGNNYPIPPLGLYSSSKTPYGGYMPGYGNKYTTPYKNPYKSQDNGYSMGPYNNQPLTYSNPAYGPKVDQYSNDKQSYGNNNFFQMAQPSSYGSGPPAPYLPPKTIDAPGPEKIYGNQPPYATGNSPYGSDKIEELKTQIYALQNAISTYNRPEYTQTAEDKSTIHNLEQQIEELKGIVNSLNGYSGEQQNYPSLGPSQYEPNPYNSPIDPKNADSFNRDNEKKTKRSINDAGSENKSESTNVEERVENHNNDGAWNKITSFFKETIEEFDKPSNKTKRRKRSVDDNMLEDNSSSNVMDKLTTVLREVLEDDTDNTPKSMFGGSMSPNTMNSLSRSAENQQSNMIPKQTSLQDIKNRIDHLKKQLENPKPSNEAPDKARSAEQPGQTARSSSRHSLLPEPSYGFNYALNKFSPDLSVKSKKLDIFKEIVARVMDKVIESLPVILQKLFGFAVHELTAYGDDYSTAYGAESSYLSVFRNLGIFGYLPLILLRVVNAISTFIYILQKNKFLKYFLVPAGVVLLVTGGMVFLIWWMQPGDFYVNYDKLSYDKESSYGGDYYAGEYGKNNGQIVKTYNSEDGKSRIHPYNNGADAKPLQPTGYPAFYKPNLVVPSDNQLPVYNE
ncbi:uncharacterized protein LOC123682673 [Harmonia axyridis]|uniref:uncharacterized protein LOC123682673 n=1 Tax=Harmonia axyridis TaxID=115357 RepID=UPI001E279B3B|nr:uncharacterized protein LOC123682673 [Harmonia axyridis]